MIESYSAFHFIRPAWFFALLPAAALLIYLFKQRVSGQRLDQLGDPRLVSHLVLEQSTPSHNGLFWLLGLGWLITIIALAGPAWEKQPQPVYRASAARVIILDLSASMNAQDLQPSRLTRARFKLEDILKNSREGQTALIVFSGEPHVVTPLTDDAATITAMLPALTVDIMPAPGNDLVPALLSAQKLFQRASVKSGEILVLTDGVDDVSETITTINRLRQNDIRISVMGLGTKTLDERVLREFSRSGGGLYHRLSADDKDINALLTTLDMDLSASSQQNQDFDLWIEQGVWLTLPLLLLAALGFRRGLLLWFVMIMVPQPELAYAFEWADLWSRADQRAERVLKSGDAKTAAKQFEDPQWQAAAQYQAGDYENSESSYRALNNGDATYNHANSLARLGKLEEAIAEYDQVLEQVPAHEDATFNRELIQKMLDQQENRNNLSPIKRKIRIKKVSLTKIVNLNPQITVSKVINKAIRTKRNRNRAKPTVKNLLKRMYLRLRKRIKLKKTSNKNPIKPLSSKRKLQAKSKKVNLILR